MRDGQFYVRRIFWHPDDALSGDLEIVGRSNHNIGDESLRVAVIEREPTALDLHHDFVSL